MEPLIFKIIISLGAYDYSKHVVFIRLFYFSILYDIPEHSQRGIIVFSFTPIVIDY